VHGYARLCKAVHSGYVRLCKAVRGYARLCKAVRGYASCFVSLRYRELSHLQVALYFV